ncbi:MAG TPA: outer membrane beta-barrel protein [Saprospiraceae bacterium]|nr:outer membrane beta-barrel protein [Saprospiraceae bacterium]
MKAGLQVTPVSVKSSYKPTSLQPGIGFLAGVLGEYEPSKNVVLSAGLQLSTLSHTIEYSDPIDYYRETYRYNLYYAHVPLVVRLQQRGLSAGAGLFAGWAFAGTKKTTLDFRQVLQERSEKIKFGQDENHDLHRLDWGPLAELGYSFRNFRLSGHYWLGLSNILPKYYRDLGNSRRLQAFGAALTYYLGEGE